MGTKFHCRFVLGTSTVVLHMASWAWAADDLAPIRAQLQLPNEEVEYAATKLMVDGLVDPAIDPVSVRKALHHWEQIVRSQIPSGANNREVLHALLRVLYQAGDWNDNSPFSYDLSDPLGHNPKTKQLATYLATRKGTCVSMPLLVAILGQRLGLPVALATAPNHVMVKFADDTQGTWLNIESTAGGFKYDSSYEQETGISDTAIENGLYLRPLSAREGIAVILGTLMEHHGANKDGDALMDVADLALSANPRDPVALIWKANAYYLQLQERYIERYPSAADIPAGERDDYQRLSRENLVWFERAERLGWTQKTPEQESSYIEFIEREKARRGQ